MAAGIRGERLDELGDFLGQNRHLGILYFAFFNILMWLGASTVLFRQQSCCKSFDYNLSSIQLNFIGIHWILRLITSPDILKLVILEHGQPVL